MVDNIMHGLFTVLITNSNRDTGCVAHQLIVKEETWLRDQCIFSAVRESLLSAAASYHGFHLTNPLLQCSQIHEGIAIHNEETCNLQCNYLTMMHPVNQEPNGAIPQRSRRTTLPNALQFTGMYFEIRQRHSNSL